MCAMLALAACSSKPSEKEVKELAQQYLASMPFGGGGGSEIKVIKSYVKDGNVVMVIQSGNMICDMPMMKTDKGWIARGISCGG